MAPNPKLGAFATARVPFHLQFITVPTADTPGTAILLHFDDQRYFFGQLSEGFQRACIQRGLGLRKIRHLFLSGPTKWKLHGGLIGFILSLADVQLRAEADNPEPVVRERLHIHGGPKLLHSVACARRFVFRTGMPLTVHENQCPEFRWQEEPTYSDENIRVWTVPVYDSPAAQRPEVAVSSFSDIEQEQSLRKKIVSDMFESDWRRDRLFERPFKDVKMPATVWIRNPETKDLQGFRCLNHDNVSDIAPDQTVLVRDPWPASLIGDLPTASNLPENVSMSYVVKGYPQRGAFDPKKAAALGIKPGPAYGELTSGNLITLDDGTLITPEMVLGPPREGKGFAFFDLPSRDHLVYLKMLLETQPFSVLEGVSVIIWTLGPTVSSADDFKHLLSSLCNIEHIVGDADRSPNRVGYESSALSSLMIARAAPHQFPALNYNNTGPYDDADGTVLADHGSLSSDASHVSLARPGTKISVQPKYTLDESEIQRLFGPETIEDKELAQTLKELQEAQQHANATKTDLAEPELITLGTGSALPSKYRAVSSTLLRMPGNQGNYLFDCGENTLGQLKRTFSASELRDILRDLRAIWISHLHADHHLGTISVLQERGKAFEGLSPDADRTIYLISERNMLDFVHEYSSVEPSLLTDTGLVLLKCDEYTGPTLNGMPFSFENSPYGIRKLESVRVSHCAGAQAVSMTFKDGFKISYSGDCRPSSGFCRIGMNSDVLIHEATFDNNMQGDAMAKKHCTTAEALGVGFKMRAKNVVLTHFSQRYQKIPNLTNVKLPDEIQFEEGTAVNDDGPVDDGTIPTTAASEAPPGPQHESAHEDDQSLPSISKGQQQARRTAASEMHIAVAFDYMRVKVSEIAHMKDVYPKIQALFDEQGRKAEERKEAERKRLEEAERKRMAHLVKGGGMAKKGKGQRKTAGNGDLAAAGMNENGEIIDRAKSSVDEGEAESRQINELPSVTPRPQPQHQQQSVDAEAQTATEAGAGAGAGDANQQTPGSNRTLKRRARDERRRNYKKRRQSNEQQQQ